MSLPRLFAVIQTLKHASRLSDAVWRSVRAFIAAGSGAPRATIATDSGFPLDTIMREFVR
jgi:hypothetical protein